jgi:heme/copper-type cytochrome/quinol oxidase subunit 3
MSANSNTNIIDVSGLSPFNYGSQAPLWWGFIGMIIVESTVIATLIASYLYLKMGSISWPPAGTANPDLLLPTVNTIILLASSVSMYWADSSIERGKQKQLTYGLTISILLALLFLGLKAYEYSHLSYDWSTHSYGSIVWGISIFHATHVLSLVLKTIFVLYLELQGYFNRQRRLGVTVNGIYWHFVVAAWVPLYLILYWSPRIL